MKPLTLAEAAQFLRMSRSSLYQRRDIPKYRRPGGRTLLFDQDELETWLKQGRLEGQSESVREIPATTKRHQVPEVAAGVVDISSRPIYHRNAQYR
jgi:excisionase family DNA binding protein